MVHPLKGGHRSEGSFDITSTSRSSALRVPEKARSSSVLPPRMPHPRAGLGDELPPEDWLPLLIRCRQLVDGEATTVLEILDQLCRHAELPGAEEAFGVVVRDALQAGRALILVDGLDELPKESLRSACSSTSSAPSCRLILQFQ